MSEINTSTGIVIIVGMMIAGIVAIEFLQSDNQLDEMEERIELLQKQADKTYEDCIQEFYRGTPNLRGH